VWTSASARAQRRTDVRTDGRTTKRRRHCSYLRRVPGQPVGRSVGPSVRSSVRLECRTGDGLSSKRRPTRGGLALLPLRRTTATDDAAFVYDPGSDSADGRGRRRHRRTNGMLPTATFTDRLTDVGPPTDGHTPGGGPAAQCGIVCRLPPTLPHRCIAVMIDPTVVFPIGIIQMRCPYVVMVGSFGLSSLRYGFFF
jgi:hypothetical protein